MRLSELAQALCARHKMNGAELDAWMDDLKASGVKDGPALQAAFDSWRAEWKYQRAPRPAEFAVHYHIGNAAATVDSDTRRWREIRKPAMGFARDYLIHSDLVDADDYSVTIKPLSPFCARWWAIDEKRAEVARLLGKEVIIRRPRRPDGDQR